MRTIDIAGRKVGDRHEPFIVAEAAFNHHGLLRVAKDMVQVAAEAGCDAIKFQTYTTEQFCQPDDPMFGAFKRGELPREEWPAVKAECDRNGIMFMSTPQNVEDLELLLQVGIPAVKIGSDDSANMPLLHSMSEMTTLPFILSSGMSELDEIRQALISIGAYYGRPTALLVCSSQYPCPPSEANLARITTLRERLANVAIGYSDHTQGLEASIVAVALGAAVLEKHFALQPEDTVDHAHALGPKGLQMWVKAIRKAYAMVGDGQITLTQAARESQIKWRRIAGQQIRGVSA
jgi:sialic acid synthase SpsE